MPEQLTLCAGDLFITSAALAAAATSALGGRTVEHSSRWPDEPFRSVDGVRESAGDPAELAALVHGATVLLTHLAPITAAVIEAAPQLRVVGVTRGGPVNVDLEAATAHGVPVLYLPGRNLEAVAEYVIGAMISLSRGLTAGSADLAGGIWDARYFRYSETGPELASCTVGLVGLGAIGSRVAALLAAFGARVLAFDPFAAPATAESLGAELIDLPGLLAQSDFVSVHARLTPETHAMFNADTFAAMKPGARFINTARGELVDQGALLAALESGRLSGAALDVFDPEPPGPGEALLIRRDVLATPHLAGASRQVADHSVRRITAAVRELLASGAADHCANREALSNR